MSPSILVEKVIVLAAVATVPAVGEGVITAVVVIAVVAFAATMAVRVAIM